MIDLLVNIHDVVDSIPPALQFLAVFVIGAVPFLEAETGGAIGSLVGVPWPLALLAAFVGNITVVTFATRLGAAAAQHRRRKALDSSKGRRVTARVERWGTPVATLLCSTVMALPVTAFIMTAAGLSRSRVLFWHAVTSLLWGTAGVLLAEGFAHLVGIR